MSLSPFTHIKGDFLNHSLGQRFRDAWKVIINNPINRFAVLFDIFAGQASWKGLLGSGRDYSYQLEQESPQPIEINDDFSKKYQRDPIIVDIAPIYNESFIDYLFFIPELIFAILLAFPAWVASQENKNNYAMTDIFSSIALAFLVAPITVVLVALFAAIYTVAAALMVVATPFVLLTAAVCGVVNGVINLFNLIKNCFPVEPERDRTVSVSVDITDSLIGDRLGHTRVNYHGTRYQFTGEDSLSKSIDDEDHFLGHDPVMIPRHKKTDGDVDCAPCLIT